MKKLILLCIVMLALCASPITRAQTTYENYSITTLTTTETFHIPYGAAVDLAGNLYVSDVGRYVIFRITPSGQQSVYVGKDGISGSVDGRGSAARLQGAGELAIDRRGNLYFGDGIGTIRMVSPGRVVTTLAGSPTETGSADGTGGDARFNSPRSVSLDRLGNIYVADANNNTIRMITPDNVVTTLAGIAGAAGSADGTGSAARFFTPNGIATGRGGYLYVADSHNNTIRQITTPGAVVTTVAGLAGAVGSTDGTGSTARFNYPESLAIDGENNLYITDNLNYTIRKMTPERNVTTLAGDPGRSGFVDGIGQDARFAQPFAIAVDASATIYVADSMSFGPGHVRVGVPAE